MADPPIPLEDIASAHVGIHPDAIAVTDGVQVRVLLGAIGGTLDDGTGAYTASSYGIKVVSSDGTTVIIDGTSNMFKIVASGTLSKVVAASAINQIVDVTITGSYTTPPMVLAACTESSTVTALREYGPYGTQRASGYASDTSVGFTANAMVYAGERSMSVGGFLASAVTPTDFVVRLSANDTSGVGYTALARYYVLQEVAI